MKFKLHHVLDEKTVSLDKFAFSSKEEVFLEMAKMFKNANIIDDESEFIAALNQREMIGSTYMGRLIALPHGKSNTVLKPGIGFCRCEKSFKYKSYGEVGYVKYIFMLAVPESQSGEDHMRILASLAGLLVNDSFVESLDNCKDYNDLVALISDYN